MALKAGIAKNLTAPGLAARGTALELTSAVLDERTPLDEACARHAGLAALDDKDRAFARHLTATILRRLRQIDALIDRCLDKPLPKRARDVRYLLRAGVAQIVFLQTPAHAAVDTAVNLAEVYGFQPQKGFVNAILRRIAREGPAALGEDDAGRTNAPDWLWQSWSVAYGAETARAIAGAHLAEPPLDITLKADAAAWAARLEGEMLPTGSVRRRDGGAVADLAGYDDGAWWVQDTAATLPVKLLGDVADRAVIDLCAAPGGKTAQLVHAGARVTAVDRAAARLRTLSDNLARLDMTAALIEVDAVQWRPAQPADAVLLDAPCTATGTLRRHPDIAWLKRPEDVAAMAARQQELLEAAAAMVRPGGLVVFCTCSLQVEEGPAQVLAFLNAHPDFARDRIAPDEVFGFADWLTERGELRTLPCHLADQGGMDGFFAARLIRTR